MHSDPLRELETWARKAERRVGWTYRFSRLRTALRQPRRPRWFRRRRLLALVMVVVAVALLWFSRENWTQWGHNQSVSPGSAGPFDGTPAASFAQGGAGFIMPAATALNGWTTQQVDDALEHVRRGLIAAYDTWITEYSWTTTHKPYWSCWPSAHRKMLAHSC
jgi:hypothetical protein